jgi:hypothetical protein
MWVHRHFPRPPLLVSNVASGRPRSSVCSDQRLATTIFDKLAGDKTRLAQLVAINTPAQTELPPDGVTSGIRTDQ